MLGVANLLPAPSSLHTAGPVWFRLDSGCPQLVLICPDFHPSVCLERQLAVPLLKAKASFRHSPQAAPGMMVRKLVSLTFTVQISFHLSLSYPSQDASSGF